MNILSKIFSFFNYKIVNADEVTVDFQLFKSLVSGYECMIHEFRNVSLNTNEERFKLLTILKGTPPPEAYFIIQSLAQTQSVEGDICEFGVAQGCTSALMANEIKSGTKKLHLFDSFQGLSQPTEDDILKDDIFKLGSMEAYAGTMSCPEKEVLERLKSVRFDKSRFLVHRGFIDEIIKTDDQLPKQVSFAYVDFDLYAPIKTALYFLDSVLTAKGIVIVDDYNFFSLGAQKAVDEFIDDKNKLGTRYNMVIPDKKYGFFSILYRI